MKKCCHHHAHERQELPALKDRLRRESRKVTGPRAAILEILRQHPHPLTAKEILGEMPAGECDLATVYRSLHLLEKMGMAKRYHFHDGAARFELMAEGDDGHHHHLVCVKCSATVELEECFPAEIERKIAEKNGFKAVTHKLEFFGICPECQG